MARKTVKEALKKDSVAFAPGVWDGISAKAATEAGFPIVLAAGVPIAASLGLPDADIYSKADNLNALRTVARNTDSAIVSDIDYGYGNSVNVWHTVRDFEAAGASAMFLEDQVPPKRCNYSASDTLPVADLKLSAGKVKAAVDARQNPDTLIIARTDAEGDDILRRGEAYAKAGAHMILPIAMDPSFDASCWERLHKETGLPLVCASIPGGWQEREFTPEVLKQIGVQLVFVALNPLNAAIEATRKVMKELRNELPVDVSPRYMPHGEFTKFIGWPQIAEIERKYETEFEL